MKTPNTIGMITAAALLAACGDGGKAEKIENLSTRAAVLETEKSALTATNRSLTAQVEDLTAQVAELTAEPDFNELVEQEGLVEALISSSYLPQVLATARERYDSSVRINESPTGAFGVNHADRGMYDSSSDLMASVMRKVQPDSYNISSEIRQLRGLVVNPGRLKVACQLLCDTALSNMPASSLAQLKPEIEKARALYNIAQDPEFIRLNEVITQAEAERPEEGVEDSTFATVQSTLVIPAENALLSYVDNQDFDYRTLRAGYRHLSLNSEIWGDILDMVEAKVADRLGE